MTWFGYPNTTGLSAIDHRITDAIADPPGQTEAFHSEALLRLPENFSRYRPSGDSPEVSPLPASASGAVTFGCFNNFAKVTPEWHSVWANILKAVPGSRLLLKAKSLVDASIRQELRARFSALGISPERLELNGDELSVAAHLSLYHRVDVVLDTFPYHGTTATCEALWMGVPVIALAGQMHVSRVGVGLLSNLGASEWIAHTQDEDVAKTVDLVKDLEERSNVRGRLRSRMKRSPLCDAVRFTRNLEAAYRRAWRDKIARR